jgi:N-acyl-D-aspartate/D-glutamate deacylase
MPEVVNDLPAGARRLVQRARGIAATVVGGEVVLRDGKHTGALRVGCSAVPTPGARPCEPDYLMF